MTKKILSFLLPILMAPVAQADVTLAAIGKIDGSYQDLSPRTAGALENGLPGNNLGGLGSGLAYAGGNTFIGLPDRGPNAVSYNAAIDNTTSYINRFQTLNLALATNPNYDPLTVGSLPLILSAQLTATTLLSSSLPLTYGTGGAPALNTASKYYFTGRSDGFNPAKRSTTPSFARLDPEGIRVSNDGKMVFISDEYGPFVYQFSRNTGKFVKSFRLPDYYAVTKVRAFEKGADGEIAVNSIGRTTNKGMEGLAITPDGTTLVGAMQTELRQDTAKYVRIITIEISTGITHEYAYLLTDGSGVSEIVAINNHEFLVDERDGKGLGDSSSAKVKKLFKIDINQAGKEITGLSVITAGTPTLTKTLFLDVVAKLNENGVTSDKIPAKIEGVAFGPDVTVGGVTKHTLFVANDNDFLSSVGGISNPNQYFVFTFTDTDLPNYVPQTITPFTPDNGDRG